MSDEICEICKPLAGTAQEAFEREEEVCREITDQACGDQGRWNKLCEEDVGSSRARSLEQPQSRREEEKDNEVSRETRMESEVRLRYVNYKDK